MHPAPDAAYPVCGNSFPRLYLSSSGPLCVHHTQAAILAAVCLLAAVVVFNSLLCALPVFKLPRHAASWVFFFTVRLGALTSFCVRRSSPYQTGPAPSLSQPMPCQSRPAQRVLRTSVPAPAITPPAAVIAPAVTAVASLSGAPAPPTGAAERHASEYFSQPELFSF